MFTAGVFVRMSGLVERHWAEIALGELVVVGTVNGVYNYVLRLYVHVPVENIMQCYLFGVGKLSSIIYTVQHAS